MPVTKKWRDSEAKKQLITDLKDGTVPLRAVDMPPLDVYNSRPVYQEHGYEQFRDRLNALRKQIREKRDNSLQDAAALEHDRAIHPKASHDHRGILRWEGSEAEQQLRQDVIDQKDRSLKPKELWASNDKYKQFPLPVFRGHIYQERRLQKFLKWLETQEEYVAD
jgi:hypothetical protein